MTLLVASGCATAQKQHAQETGEVLITADFEIQNADTPAQKAHLNSLPQHKIFKIKRQGKDWYVYADAKGCGCLYVGDYEDYQRYKDQAWEHYLQTGQERLEYVSGDRKTSGGWNDWGPW
ncbi:MAG: hypothetical protein K9K66_01825 [Desulfarculaceae bacterium]|nr:hypothetical protein [Desulfarculaceae bacterium]MCF8073479.1 hypothetical protein [Desulfarculaceae bacterium]MCF8100374.1 hypothetical protein [Desulfarculaceae bacterium]MCF8115890.1 hypothetical protein [Desulfarculaceae bacterium]